MFKTEILILENEDLRRDCLNDKISNIEIYSFQSKSRDFFRKEKMIIYIDNKTHRSKILKNRCGIGGVVNKENNFNIIYNKIKRWIKNLL